MTKKILLVEDDADLRGVYELLLSTKGHTVKTAANGLLALQTLQNFTPDIILLDALMPEMDGLEFLRNYNGDPKLVRIYILSNLSDEEIITEMLSLGAREAFVKAHITPDKLLSLIAS